MTAFAPNSTYHFSWKEKEEEDCLSFLMQFILLHKVMLKIMCDRTLPTMCAEKGMQGLGGGGGGAGRRGTTRKKKKKNSGIFEASQMPVCAYRMRTIWVAENKRMRKRMKREGKKKDAHL